MANPTPFAQRRPRPFGRGLFALAAASLALAAVPARAAVPLPGAAGPIEALSGSIDDFYAARGQRPLWLGEDGRGAQALLALFAEAEADGLDPRAFDTRPLRKAMRKASSDPVARLRADRALSKALVDYVIALRTGSGASNGWDVGHPLVAPHAPSALALLDGAAGAGDLAAWVEAMPWMHSSYAQLRAALIDEDDPARAERLRVNLARTRLLPATRVGRYVLVNAAAQRLYMVEDGRVVDWMKVVVGKADQPTPMLASAIDHADLNPYWNLPVDLVAERVAPNVVKDGLGYLKAKGYEVLDGFEDDAKPISPAGIDWNAAAAGKLQLRMRQKPGPSNAMGAMKFMFPSRTGVYLHDTPNKELMTNDARLNSAGCVRLQDAPRLARWLWGKPLTAKGSRPEQRVDLPSPVPVYLAYLTAVPSGGGEITYYDDIYGRDAVRLAQR